MSNITIKDSYLNFIPKIYDTVLNPDSWEDVLLEFAGFFGAPMATLFLNDLRYSEFTNIAPPQNVDPVILQEFITKYGPDFIAVIPRALQKDVGIWMDSEYLFQKPIDEIDETAFQIKHFGLKHRALARLNDTPLWADAITLNFDVNRDGITKEEETIGNLFIPHFAKAVEMKRPFSLLHHRYQAIFSVLDRIKVGLIITNSTGEVVISNSAAEEMLSTGNNLKRNAQNHIQIHPEDFNLMLKDNILQASTPTLSGPRKSILAVPKRDEGLSWIIETQPLSDMGGNISGHFQGAMTFITDPDRKEIISTEGMEQLFQLTSAESEICKLIAQGSKAEDIAEMRNVSLGTVRTQIRALLEKTQTNNQLDLVRLALKVNLPVDEVN